MLSMKGLGVGALLDTSDLKNQVAELDLPGLVVTVWGSSGLHWSITSGVADLASGQPMTADLRMRVGSLTKMFTATLILQLIERGHFNLDTALTALLPHVGWLAPAAPITVRHLLSMRSGIYDYTETAAAARLFFPAEQQWHHRDLVDLVRDHEPYGQPGQVFRYSNTNYALLALIVEATTGLPYERALRPLLEQSGVTSTSYPAGSALESPAARGYVRVTDTTSRQQVSDTSVIRAQPRFKDVTSIAASAAGAAGGLVSTAADLNTFVRAVANGSLLSQQLHGEQLGFQPVGVDGSGYGLGIASDRGLLGHHGSILGYSSYAGYHRPTDLAITILANCEDDAEDTSLISLVDHILEVIER